MLSAYAAAGADVNGLAANPPTVEVLATDAAENANICMKSGIPNWPTLSVIAP